MKYIILSTVALLFAAPKIIAQKFVIEKSYVSFFSHATIEDIKADNKKASGIFNSSNGDIVFSIPIHEFQFEKSLMQEHFNEKYLESDKYPKATFQGKISGFDASKNETQEALAKGKMTIHGVTQEVEIPGTIQKKKENYFFTTKFVIKLADYKIEIPQLLWQNIAEQVEVSGEFNFKPQ